MIEKTVTIQNKTGLHARPATALVKLAGKYESEFYIYRHGYQINGKSILGVMTLAAEQGAELKIELNGPDETEATQAIVALIESGFKEVYDD